MSLGNERVEVLYMLDLEEVKVPKKPQERRHEAESEKLGRRLTVF